jgi:hypothetical protein
VLQQNMVKWGRQAAHVPLSPERGACRQLPNSTECRCGAQSRKPVCGVGGGGRGTCVMCVLTRLISTGPSSTSPNGGVQ